MVTKRTSSAGESKSPRRPPAMNPEDREKQLIAMAYDVAEQQLRDGTISSQVLTQLLRSGSVRDRLERKRIETQYRLDEAKYIQIQEAQREGVLYEEAIKAMRHYSGNGDAEDYAPPL